MIIQITRKTWRILGIILAIAVAGIIYMFPKILDPIFSRGEETQEETVNEEVSDIVKGVHESTAEASESSEADVCAVHVSGAVMDPDRVWFLPEGSRVSDAIQTAGGALETADLSRLNLAQLLIDGQKVYVPFQGEEADDRIWAEEQETQGSYDMMININTAGKEALMELPGIGNAYAERIIQYRTENGPFSSIEEITNVKGIGEKTFEKFKDRICI